MRIRTARFLFALALCACAATIIRADTISGTVKDPDGLLVPSAQVEITGGNLSAPIRLTTGQDGKFIAPDLKPGKYTVRVTREGFDPLITAVDLHGAIDLQLALILAAQQTNVTVTAKSSGYANSDPLYLQLRNSGLGDTFKVENMSLGVDVGSLHFKTGTLTLLAPVNGIDTGAIFVGEGHFSLKPVTSIDQHELSRRTGAAAVEEDFTSVVIRYTRNFAPQVRGLGTEKTATPPAAEEVFRHWKEHVRHSTDTPINFTEGTFDDESMDNVDAEELAALYNPNHPAFINAFIQGVSHKDLRYFVRLRVGAVPQLDSPEEVALINFGGDSMEDGIWYADHLKAEIQNGTANSREDRRIFAARSYKIETDVSKNDHLFSRATISLTALIPGERVIKFDLLPRLRVTRVADQNGKDLHFVQEGHKQDGSFYAILDEPFDVGAEHAITVEYEGDKVLFDAGSGSYYVAARTAWYPNVDGFNEKSMFDLTFKVPPHNKVISVGKLESESTEDGFAVSHWVTPTPVAVAGFNYGQYLPATIQDSKTHYNISGYYLSELPDYLQLASRGGVLPGQSPEGGAPGDMRMSALAAMSPRKMTDYMLDQTRAQMELCTYYFGRGPYDSIAVTEQPNFNFGQSWPGLIYLPIMAYIDSTQRWMLFGQISQEATGFVREVTPHEVAHQWWGHGVTWASYHDLWLSEGFAEFSAGLFLQQAVGEKWQHDYIDFWDRQKRHVLEKNNFGVSPDEAGPLWMGIRLISPKSLNAYQGDIYAKGAYVLEMLRSIMYDDNATKPEDKEKVFIDTMHDFVETHRNAPASTESFMAVVNKHVPPNLDLTKNGRLDWFFQEWVFGTEVPKYDFKYESVPGDGKSVRIRATITQSEVSPNFAMFVPVFADFGQGMVRLNQLEMVGNSTRTIDFVLPLAPKKVALNYYKEILER
jgi:Peptidase family M1 domain/Carboxypeptidase regulatory-like domain